MKVSGTDYRTVWMRDGTVYYICQNHLPFSFVIEAAYTYQESCSVIRAMRVRGAGAIGALAGYAMAQSALEAPVHEYLPFIEAARKEIESTRPTARNLFHATDKVFQAALISAAEAVRVADDLADKDSEASRQIGLNGEALIRNGMRIETHCNAGWLAFVDYGTALSPLYMAHQAGKDIFVYVDETRPRSQGARLTAWELHQAGIPHAIIPDNAGAWLMSQGSIDMMIVGADRIAANGDTANKIGTLEKAIAAAFYGIPFYVAAPTSTFDAGCPDGKAIPIEERSQEEVLYMEGITDNGIPGKILVCSPGSGAFNPAFDVTPSRLITGIITEKGIIRPDTEAIRQLLTTSS